MAWLDDWANRIRVTVRNDVVDSDLTDFPVMINLSNSSGMSKTDLTEVFDEISDSDRKKIAITSANGTTQQYIEIESWDSSIEKAILWTKCSTVYSSSTNTLYLYYDSSQTTNSGYVGDTGDVSATNVWDNSFKGVWHMAESGGPYKNSTSIAGMDGAGSPVPTRVTDFIGYAQNFDGDRIDISDSIILDFTTQMSIEVLVNLDTIQDSALVVRDTNSYSLAMYSTGKISWGKSGVDELQSSATLTNGRDYYLTANRKDSDNTDYIYIDGVLDNSGVKADFDEITSDVYIGASSAGTWALDGVMDEVRLSNIDRSEEYIKANQYNLYDNMVVFETTPSGATWLDGWSKRIELTIDSAKVDENLFDYPLLITLASGTGMNNADVTAVFDELTVTNAGTIDSDTKLLLHMDGDASSSVHTITTNGDPQITSTAPTGFDHSFYFDGVGDYLAVPNHSDFDINVGNFTIDVWVKFTGAPSGYEYFVTHWQSGSDLWQMSHVTDGGLGLRFGIYVSSSWFVLLTGGQIFDTDWHHIAVVKSGDTYYLFKDGNIIDTDTVVNSATYDGTLFIGNSGALSSPFPGYMSELRISKGTDRGWTSGFTPPTGPYTTTSGIDSDTRFLLHPEGDRSVNKHDVTFNGNVAMDSSVGKFDDSYSFDGNSGYITIATHSDFDFSSNDFAIECWFRCNNVSQNNQVILGGHVDHIVNIIFNRSSSGQIYLFLSSNGSTWDIVDADSNAAGRSTTSSWTNGAWHHMVLNWDGSTYKLFIDGALEASISSSSGLYSTLGFTFGKLGAAADYYFNGYIDEFRVSKGTARWTKNFNPPNNPYPNYIEVVSWEDKKIAITESDGLKQQYVEIEDWNPYTERAWLWTKVPFISSSEDTTLYLYYDSTQPDNILYVGDTGEEPAKNVWDNHFMGVWHMAQDPSGGSSSIKDSTSNVNHGTSAGSMTTGDLVDGKIGKAMDFDGDDDEINLGTHADLDLTSAFTYEAIFKTSTVANAQDIITKFDETGGDYQIELHINVSDGSIASNIYNEALTGVNADTNNGSGGAFDDNNYYYVATNIDLALDGKNRLFTNGVLNVTSSTAIDNINSLSAIPTTIGERYNAAANIHMAGILDEIRISNIKRSDTWIKATYYRNWDVLITFGTPTSRTTFVFNGYVKVYGIPSARTVHLYRRSTGEYVGSVTSDAITGYFEIPGAYDDYHFVVVLPELNDGFNLLSYDKIHPSV